MEVEEAVPPAVASWTVAQVAAWMKASEVPGAEEVAEKLIEEEVDGDLLLSYRDMQQVKEDLGLSSGKANKVWKAVLALKAPPGGAAVAADTAAAGATGSGAHVPSTTAMMVPCPLGSETYTHADSLLRSSWAKSERYQFLRLVEVREIKNPEMLGRYEAYKATLPADAPNGNEQLLFHGCANGAIGSIAEKGFLKSFQTSAAGSWQRFGPGFYFALQASKSHEYPLADMTQLPVGQVRTA